MEIVRLIIEFLKVLLSAQVVAGVIAVVFFALFRDDIKALMRRVATIRFPGGEVSTSQAERSSEAAPTTAAEPKVPSGEQMDLPKNIALNPEQVKQLSEIFHAERASAYLWEYRYLNYFLVPQTQRVLDWLASLKDRPSLYLYGLALDSNNPQRRGAKSYHRRAFVASSRST